MTAPAGNDQEMLALAQRLQELAIMLGGTDRFVRNTAAGDVWLPASGSSADAMRGIEAEVSSADFGWSTLCLILTAVLDHLGTLRVLLSPQDATLFGPRVVARSALEASARLRWLTDAEGGPAESLRRAHSLRCDGLRYRLRMHQDFDVGSEMVTKLKTHLDEAVELAKSHGATSTKVPGHTELVRQLFEAAGLDTSIGSGIYNGLSGIAHAQPSALLEFFGEGTPPPGAHSLGEDALFLQGEITLGQLEMSVILTTYGVTSALDATLPFMGWRTDLWPNWRDHMMRCAFKSELMKMGNAPVEDTPAGSQRS